MEIIGLVVKFICEELLEFVLGIILESEYRWIIFAVIAVLAVTFIGIFII